MCRREFVLTGIIQGVGFRPFVYRQATARNLSGHVQNDGNGVRIVVEGEQKAVESFTKSLRHDLPPLARIDTLEERELTPIFTQGFEIISSDALSGKGAFLPPDIALCDACIEDMQNPSSRFYRYPFTTCTDCGPRYSIIKTVPYDRPNTSMAPFVLCPECQREYDDPANRRYHAQPLACPTCGPVLSFYEGERVTGEGEKALEQTARLIRNGGIVAVKGMGGFHLMCDATNEAAISALRKRKRRPAKPLAVMFKNLAQVEADIPLDDGEKHLIASRERPILLTKKPATSTLAPGIAPGIDRLGILLAYTPLHHLLFEQLKTPLVATSANLSDAPIAKNAEELTAQMGGVIDGLLDFNREIVNACDDSLLQRVGEKHLTLRAGRGYAPIGIRLPFQSAKKILAVGGHQKNSIAIVFENNLILSPHIGELHTIESFAYFERTLKTLKDFYDFEPDVIVCDKHPGYKTTQWAKEQKLPLMEIQHHYAHLLATMAEHGLQESILGFAFDGTGYGDDGTIWGSEVMIAGVEKYTRCCHIRPFRLIGGEAAVKEPRRCALSLLFEHFSPDEIIAANTPTASSFTPREIHALHVAWTKELNAPLTSSAGRLFDAVASLCGIAQVSSYEGESGLLMEAAFDPAVTDSYPFSIDSGEIVLDAMVESILHEAAGGESGKIPSKFINTLTGIITHIAAEHPGLPVLLSGGVFQNRTLLERVTTRLAEENRPCYFQEATPINDGGIALGQAYGAACAHRI